MGTLDPQAAAYLKARKNPDPPPWSEIDPVWFREIFPEMIEEYGGQVEPVASVSDRRIPGPVGEIPVRVYTPEGDGPFPVLLYYHGGGWVIGDLDTIDRVVRTLTNQAECVTVSVDYRLAPEHPFPAAAEDAYAALQWVAENADILDGDRDRIAAGGDSAGGNLAAVVSLRARDEGGPRICHQSLLYPVTDVSNVETESYRENGLDYGLTQELMKWFIDYYMPSPQDRKNPLASPLLADCFDNLPPAYVLTAEFDPLKDEGDAYAERLRDAGVPVVHRVHEGQIHGFLTAAGAIDRAVIALREAGNALREAFEGQQ